MPVDALQPLSGILVVSLEQAVAAPLASRMLADAGARVIKLERHDGDFARGYDDAVNGQSSYFVWLNGGKESVAVDIKSEADRDFVLALIGKADVFVQNLAAGAAARAGFGAADLRERHPKLIVCDISGYGETGPYRDKKAYDFLVQGEAGLAAVTGHKGLPARVGISVADIACGTKAAHAITLSLLQRERTGEGATIKVSLFHALADWMNVPYLQYRYGGRDVQPAGLAHPSIAPYGAFDTLDGQPVIISVQSDREWRALAAGVLGNASLGLDPRFVTNVARCANRPACDGLVAEAFKSMPRAGLIAALNTAGIANADLNSLAQLCQHPQATFETVDADGEAIDLLASGFSINGRTAAIRHIPRLDEHGAALRQEFAAGVSR